MGAFECDGRNAPELQEIRRMASSIRNRLGAAPIASMGKDPVARGIGRCMCFRHASGASGPTMDRDGEVLSRSAYIIFIFKKKRSDLCVRRGLDRPMITSGRRVNKREAYFDTSRPGLPRALDVRLTRHVVGVLLMDNALQSH